MENTEFLSNDRLKISPRAYALALQYNVDILQINPTGPEGRIIENDILRAIEERDNTAIKEEAPVSAPAEDNFLGFDDEERAEEPAPAEVPEESAPVTAEAPAEEAAEESSLPVAAEEKPAETAIVTAPVTAIANEEKAEETKEEAPEEKPFREEDAYRHTDVIIPESENAPDGTPITIEMSFDASAIAGLRETIKERGEEMNLPSVTLNDMILFAVTKTLKKHKAMNAHFLGDTIRYFDGIHLSFAVDTEEGPKTLTVFDADRLSLSSLSKITGALVRGIRAGGEVPEKNQRRGSFTVTNVGTLGIERFIPRLTAPQTGALAVCALQERTCVIDGELVSYPAIPLALTFDPRAMSTAVAAKFLRDLVMALESFELLLIK